MTFLLTLLILATNHWNSLICIIWYSTSLDFVCKLSRRGERALKIRNEWTPLRGEGFEEIIFLYNTILLIRGNTIYQRTILKDVDKFFKFNICCYNTLENGNTSKLAKLISLIVISKHKFHQAIVCIHKFEYTIYTKCQSQNEICTLQNKMWAWQTELDTLAFSCICWTNKICHELLIFNLILLIYLVSPSMFFQVFLDSFLDG
jgi:hypothetical protein